jgi:hypothetical protein
MSDLLNFDEPDFPIANESRASAGTATDRQRDLKHRRKKKSDPLVMCLMAGSGFVLLVAFVIVGIVVLSTEKKPPSKSAPKEPGAPVNAVENKKSSANAPAAQPDKKNVARAQATSSKKPKADTADKKDKADGKMPGQFEPDTPIPIPGLEPSKPEKPSSKSDNAKPGD